MAKTQTKKANLSAKLPEYPKLDFQFSKEKPSEKIPVLSFVLAQAEDEATPPFKKEHPYYNGDAQEICQSGNHWYAGLGLKKTLDTDLLGECFYSTLKKCSGTFSEIVINLPEDLPEKISPDIIANLLATALCVTAYPTDLLKSQKSRQKPKLKKFYLSSNFTQKNNFQRPFLRYLQIGKHLNATRQTQALPGNYLTPATMELRAREIALKHKLKLTVYDKAGLEKLGAGGILAVGKGSELEPRMLVLEYNPPGATKTFALVGKGVTFDTGGISLKPSSDMHEMKFDMSGSAVAVHSIAAIAELKIPVRVICAVGMVENMPGPSALKPGDVFTAMNGLTIEVQNTDAEGRLVLADLLHYTEKKYSPNLMIDLATLTGACVVALGNFYAGLFTGNDLVARLIQDSATQSAEPVWRLPMGRLYKDLLKSDIADFNNVGGRWGGACSAASFLSAFVKEPNNWAHLDIAGVGMINKNFNVYPAGGSGYGVRLIVQIAESLATQQGV